MREPDRGRYSLETRQEFLSLLAVQRFWEEEEFSWLMVTNSSNGSSRFLLVVPTLNEC